MAQVYFHCSHQDLLLAGICEIEVDGLTEAREQAAMLVRALIAEPGPEDWRDWMLHASDDLGESLFSLPFSAFMGRPH
jgi:hypothetical protein